ncbi:hypothetical protein [Acidisphaera sp. S103]|uniref:hypothetical protein n=1 Tax=Acidisphaera sp. S103 TaxID=1747223 RepID=UPI00131C1165|nr:hypothetical protein [Acidisphaera sp. S103]
MDENDCVTLDELAERYYAEGDGTRKGPSYLASYTRLLQHRRQEKLRILELGVSSGASLLSWRDYLPHATIVGIDIAAAPPRVLGQDRIYFIQGSQDDPAVLDQAAKIAGGGFDLIVDDASHIGYLTKRSLHYLFPRWLVPGGCYVIEDFGTGFLREYPDGRDFAVPNWNDAVPDAREFHSSQHGMVGVVKQLVEPLMQELMTASRPYLAIERLTIETNIVFIDKSLKPGGPLPVSAQTVGAQPAAEGTEARLDALVETVRDHADRIAGVERLLLRLLRILGPALWVRRSVRGLFGR